MIPRLTADQFIKELEIAADWQIITESKTCDVELVVTDYDGNVRLYRGPSLKRTAKSYREYIAFLNRLGEVMKENGERISRMPQP